VDEIDKESEKQRENDRTQTKINKQQDATRKNKEQYLPILLEEICGPILGIYINRSQTHEYGNWD
jgi:hypothetical protein